MPPQVRDLCMRCLVKAPAARPSAEEAAAVLAAAAGVAPRPSAEELDVVLPAPAPAVDAARAAAGTDDATAPADATALVVARSVPAAASPAGDDATDLVRPGGVPSGDGATDLVRPGGAASGDGATDLVRPGGVPSGDGATDLVRPGGVPSGDGATGVVRAGGDLPGEGATDVIGDDAGDRRRVLAGLAVVIAIAALLVTFALSRPTGGPQALAEAARGVAGTTATTDPAAPPSGSAGAPTPTGAQLPAVEDGTPGAGRGAGGAGGAGGGAGSGNNGNGNGNGGPGNGGAGGGAPPAAGGSPVRLGTLGGVIVAVCAGNQVNVTGAEPAAGATLVSLQTGPRNKSRVEFNLAGTRLRFEVRCAGGVPVAAPD